MPGDKKKMAVHEIKPIKPDWDSLERIAMETNLAAISLEAKISQIDADNKCDALFDSLMNKDE